jgi:hypothetical protein
VPYPTNSKPEGYGIDQLPQAERERFDQDQAPAVGIFGVAVLTWVKIMPATIC